MNGWVLRGGIGAGALVVGLVLAAEGVDWLAVGLYLALAAVTAAIPASAAAVLLVGYPAVAMAFVEDAGVVAVSALVVLLHLLHLTTAYAAVVPVSARLDVAALRAPAKRFGLVQLAAFALVGVVYLIPPGTTDETVELVGLTAAAGLVVGTVVLLRRRG
ncbi:hypothetical protein GCM10022243_21330 [Saccharothrix violaceirubra]|uniref:Uncharacterized protein n=1 Tax=Saccharothrix violaceirubra TaxID=413306 RepID=A0A7W7T8I5_9PSEU|nr:hypothetical protein [Saccharothrix violaceirubra]MBB4968526.1 hypothetical protein [Saccharothrix violaceirubra]